jgi:hypothetical protein
MEALIEELSKGKSNILFLVGLADEDRASTQHIISHITPIQKVCPKVHVILFQNHECSPNNKIINKNDDDDNDVGVGSLDVSSLNSDRVHVIDSNQSSHSVTLHEWLKISKVIFMIDMFFSVMASSGELSTTSYTILHYLSSCQSDLQIFCLHSVSMLYQNQQQQETQHIKKKTMDSHLLSNHATHNNTDDGNSGMTNLTNAFQDVSIIHMVSQVKSI